MNRKIEFYEELPGTVGNSQIENTRLVTFLRSG